MEKRYLHRLLGQNRASVARRGLLLAGALLAGSVLVPGGTAQAAYDHPTANSDAPGKRAGRPVHTDASSQERISEEAARRELDAIYKGDYRSAFVEKKPKLFLKHIPDDFRSTSVEGTVIDAEALRQFFPQQFATMTRTIEHNVTIEDVDVLRGGTVSAVVTLNTLIEFKKTGGGRYLVTTVGTYRDDWAQRNGEWFEIRGNQLRNQSITAPRP